MQKLQSDRTVREKSAIALQLFADPDSGFGQYLLWKFLITEIATNQYEKFALILCDYLHQQKT